MEDLLKVAITALAAALGALVTALVAIFKSTNSKGKNGGVSLDEATMRLIARSGPMSDRLDEAFNSRLKGLSESIKSIDLIWQRALVVDAEVAQRVTRIEEQAKYQDAKLDDIRAEVRRTGESIDSLRESVEGQMDRLIRAVEAGKA